MNSPTRNSRSYFERLLHELHAEPQRSEEIGREIDSVFGQDKAVFVLDASGFSRTTRENGILSFLLMMHQLRLLSLPCIDANDGQLLKAEADNLFCLFDAVTDAVQAADDILLRLGEANLVLPDERRLHASVGIGYGRILNIAGEDMFGDEVNLASKLGEDIAGRGDVLLTHAACRQLPAADYATREASLDMAGMTISYFAIQRQAR